MLIPGSNLLRMANRLIRFQTVMYYPFDSRYLNEARQWVTTYGTAFPLSASVQAVPRDKYSDMGLDFAGEFIKLFANYNVIDLRRDSSGDRLIWNAEWYQMEQGKSWFLQDGWATATAVKVKELPVVNPLEVEQHHD